GAGFPVPPGFSVGQSAYLAAMDAAGVRHRLYDHRVAEEGVSEAELMTLAADLGGTVGGVEIPPRLRDDIVARYRSLGSDVPVAVRSSAPAEDAGDTSFAGIHESYTDVVGVEAVLAAVRDCWR